MYIEVATMAKSTRNCPVAAGGFGHGGLTWLLWIYFVAGH